MMLLLVPQMGLSGNLFKTGKITTKEGSRVINQEMRSREQEKEIEEEKKSR